MAKKKGIVTDQIADHVRSLKAAGLKSSEINVVLERDYSITLSKGMISGIVNGYKATDKGSFSEEDGEYIMSLQEGMETVTKEIPRIEKFGIAYMIGTSTVEEVIAHYKDSDIILDAKMIEEISEEVSEWIASGNINGENEKWFSEIIGANDKGK